MNKNRYRIIFNKARGILMAVAEHIASAGKSVRTSDAIASGRASPANNTTVTLNPTHFAVLCHLGLVSLVSISGYTNLAYADIIADPSAPKSQQPIILNAPNGVPLVNIQTPSAAGVSRNTYRQFDVNSNGAILNNSRTNTQTQLGGWVQGNPYLATGTARIILNEVNSNNPSLLNGYVEVAGSRAQVVIANPAGISCSGCGFINASRATLTTGTPIINSGDLMGYRVGGGAIDFLGAGLDSANSNYTDVIARAVNVNAGIWAQNLNVMTGSNQVNVASNGDMTSLSPISPNATLPNGSSNPTPSFALDVAALGGMYAGKIHLIGTEAGLGVSNAGNIGASAGEISIDVNGLLSNTSTAHISSTGNTTVTTTGGINNQGTLYAQGNTTLTTSGDLTNSGMIAALGNTSLTASGANSHINNTATAVIAAGLNTDGSLDTTTATLNSATGNLTMSATQSIAAFGQNLSAGDQTVTAQSIDLSGSQTVGRDLSFTASNGNLNAAQATLVASGTLTAGTTQTLTTDAAIVFANQLNLTAHDLSSVAGELVQTGTGDTTINLAGDLNNTQGRIATNSNHLTLAAHTLTNTGGSIEHAGTGMLDMTSTTFSGSAGQISSNGHLDFTANTAILDHGSTIAKQINIDTATLSNRSGEILQTGSDATSIHASISLDNTDGMIAGNGTTTLTLGDLNNQGGTLQTAGTSNLVVHATGAIDNSALSGVAGNMNAGGSVTLTAASLNNTQGQITAGNTLDVTTSSTGGGINNTQGLIAANQTLILSTVSLDNSNGTIASVHADVEMTATAGSLNNTAGEITAAQNLTINSLGVNNTDGSLLANRASIDSGVVNGSWQALDNTRGTLITTTDLDLSTGALSNDAGLIQSGGDMVMNTHGQALTNSNSGNTQGILSQGTATLTTGDLNNQTGYIGAKGVITANSAAISNHTGTMTSEATIALHGTSLDNQTGTIKALGNIDIDMANNIDNRSGLLRSGQTLTLTAVSVDNRDTQAVDSNNTPTQGIEGQSVLVSADQIDNSAGAMRADNTLVITGGGTLNNSQGKLSSTGTISISDRLANVNSNVAGKTLAITNTSGTIIAGTDLNIDSNSLTGDGKVLSKGDLSTKLISDYTHTGEWQADGNASLETTGTLTNQAELLAGNTLSLTAGTLDNQATGEIVGTSLHLAATDTHTLTNRGLIDGSDTFIDTITLNNLGTGRIYGDHVAIAATTLTNDAETVNGVTSAAVIAARDRLDIAATTITNREHALLFSAGDMAIGGSLDGNHQATVATSQPQATTLNNNSATIEALGNLHLNVATINNTNDHLTTAYGLVSESTTPARSVDVTNISYSPAPAAGNTRQYQLSYFSTDGALLFGNVYNYDQVSFYTSGFVHIVLNPGVPDAAYTDPLTGSNRDFVTFMEFNNGTIVNETHVVTSDPGQILASGSMQINATGVLNDNSKIIAGGALSGNITNLNNQETLGTRSSWATSQSAFFRSRESCNCSRYFQYLGDTAPVIQDINLGASTYLGNTAFTGTGTQVAALTTGSVNQTATGASNTNVAVNASGSQTGYTQIATIAATTQTGPATVVRTTNQNTTLPNNSLFQTNPNPTNGYYVETDPRFANYRNWLSSDYMLSALALDPALMQKRLGDGFYEQKLIREQVAQLTGRRFLTGYTDDEAQYQAIMTNGVTFAQAHQLVPGVALSAAQVAQLTSDIVWLVEKTVTLADGSTVQALVPQVYAKLREGDLDGNGSLLSADSVNFNLTGDLTNSGTIAGRSVVSLTADNINNLGGRITANNTRLTARNDINNLGGSLQGEDNLSLNAVRDINVASTTKSNRMTYDAAAGNKTIHVDVSRTNIDRVAGLYVSNPNGILVASADNNINLQGAVISNTGTNGTTVIDANHDLNLGTVATVSNNSYVRNAKNYNKNSSTQEVGTVIQTDGDLSLNAGNNLSARAADVTSDNGTLTATAGNDLTIEAGKATYASESASYKKKSGTFSSKSKTRRDTANGTDVISSTFSGDTVDISAGNNLTVTGSNIVGTNNVNLNAQNNVTLTTAQATHDETHYKKTKQSGLMSSGGVGVTIGSSKLTNTNDSQQVTNVGSTVGSVQGDVKISSGNTYTQTGSDVLTPQGNIDITAQQVDITNATDTYANQQTMKYKQSGLTLAITSPVISAIQTAQQMSKAAGKTDDTRMQALAAGTAALAASNAKDAIIAGNTPQLDKNGLQVLDANGKNTAENPANQVGGVNLSLSIGSSKSSSQTEQTNTTVKSSTVNAGGDVTITATGDGSNNPDTGNINVIGSTIKAADNVTLKADDEINLLAAQNVDTLNSKNKGSSASLGISIGSDGLLVTASASGSKGKTKGNGSTWTETQVQGGNNTGDTVRLNSGTDTTLKGAQVTGNQVVADVGTSGQGNLNIESLQDTNQYKDKQQSIGGSISVGYGVVGGSISYSDSKTKSNYQSVNEQSGIMAGDGGFQVNVNGNTDLKGAVIASTDKAIQDNKDSLTTQTLTTSNIENSAEYSAKGISFGTGVGLNKQSDDSYKNAPTASAGSANLSDDSSSVTVSGISGGSVSITDSSQQQTLSGKDTTTTVATLNRDVQTKLTTGTDAQGNTVTTAIAVDSKGNNLAGTLTPIFDQEQVQRELNAQIQITQAFSQVAPKAVADFATNKVKELVVKAQEAHLAGDDATANQLLNEAEKWNEGGSYRIALHTALGGLLTGDMSGAAGAGAVAGSADLLNQLQGKVTEALQGAGLETTDPNTGEKIPSQTANIIAQALAELTSAGMGAAIGGTAGAGTALVVDTNNRQLHQTEIDWIKKNAKAYAKYLNNGNEPTAQQIKIAEDALADQAFRQVQFGVAGTWDTQASAFLDQAQGVLAPDASFPNSGYTTMFYASPAERANAAIYLDSAINNAAFYQQHQLAQPTVAQIQNSVAAYATEHKNDVTKTLAAIALPPSLILGTLASAPAVGAAVSNFINAAIAACTGNIILCVNQAAIEAAGLIEGAPVTSTIIGGAAIKASQELKLAADELKLVATDERVVSSLFKQDRKFWSAEATEFNGSSVYQRNDLIDLTRIDNKTGLSNMELMEMGRAPIGPDGKAINLHHLLQSNDGPIAEVTQTFHQSNSATIHINSGSDIPSGINRSDFDKWRAQYWMNRADNFKR